MAGVLLSSGEKAYISRGVQIPFELTVFRSSGKSILIAVRMVVVDNSFHNRNKTNGWGFQAGFRSDGRGNQEFRPVELETDIITNANGSTRLRLANSDILVGVKTEVDVPSTDTPDKGKIEFFVDCSANTTPQFEGRGNVVLGTDISNCLKSAYLCSAAFDHSKLCILPGARCWKLHVDILILECGGNLFDAISMAVKAALYNTRIPMIKNASLDGDNVELNISHDLFDCTRLDTSQAPCLVTLCKIGDHFVVDPTAEEEACNAALLVVAVTPQGVVTTTTKIGDGYFGSDRFDEALNMGVSVGKEISNALEDALKREETLFEGKKKEICGFLK